jgi:hypothetical protein
MGANIPLPALDVKPPQQEADPLAAMQKLMALRSLGNQQQLQQEQIQGAGQENQQRALALQDQQTLRSSAKGLDWSQPDTFGKWITNAQQQGVSPQTLSQLALQRSQYQEQLAKTDTATLSAEKDRNSQLQGHLDAIKKDPTQAPAQAAQILSGGLVKDPGMVQKVQAMAQGQYVPSADDITGIEAGLTDHNTQIEQALKQQQTQTSAAEQGEAEATTAQKKQESQYYARTGVGAPGVPPEAVQMSSWLQNHPGKTPADYPAAKAGAVAQAEMPAAVQKDILENTNPAIQAAKLHLATATKSAEQAITDGDPNAAAKLLIDGTVAPSQIISSRKPAFAQQAFTAAAQMQPGWSATKADADFKVAGSPQNVAFFGSAKSLTDKGGTLDQLAAVAKDIPANQIPIFNSVADAIKASTGSGPVAKYAALALGVSDDYSKVMGGGQGSDTSRTQAMNIIAAKASPEQRAAAIEGIRGAVGSQTNSRIGNNAVLKKMYGGSVPEAGPTKPKTDADPLGIR